MAELTAADAQVADADVSQVDATDTGAAQTGGAKTFDEKYVSELRKEAAANRKAAKELADKLKAIEDAKLSEDEKLKKRLAELETENQTRTNELATLKKQRVIERYASQSDALDADWLSDRLTASQAIELDDAGSPTQESLDKVTKQLRAEKPHLFKPKTEAGGAQGTQQQPAPSTGGSINTQRTTQTIDMSKPLSLSDPSLWNGSLVAKK